MAVTTIDKSAYDFFIEAIKCQREVYVSATKTLDDCIAGLETLRELSLEEEPAPASAPAKPRRKTKAKVEAPAPTVTLEDVRAVMIELSRAGKREVAKEIISSYGAQALSEVDPAHFAEALEKAKEALNA